MGIVDKGTKGSYPSGIWFGGVKHTLVREQELEVEGQNVMMRALGRPKGGCVIACSKDSIVLAFFDEDKGQKSGNATNACLKFVGYLFQNEQVSGGIDLRKQVAISIVSSLCCEHVEASVCCDHIEDMT